MWGRLRATGRRSQLLHHMLSRNDESVSVFRAEVSGGPDRGRSLLMNEQEAEGSPVFDADWWCVTSEHLLLSAPVPVQSADRESGLYANGRRGAAGRRNKSETSETPPPPPPPHGLQSFRCFHFISFLSKFKPFSSSCFRFLVRIRRELRSKLGQSFFFLRRRSFEEPELWGEDWRSWKHIQVFPNTTTTSRILFSSNVAQRQLKERWRERGIPPGALIWSSFS